MERSYRQMLLPGTGRCVVLQICDDHGRLVANPLKVRNRITPAVAPGKPCSRKPRNNLPVNKRYRYGAGNCPIPVLSPTGTSTVPYRQFIDYDHLYLTNAKKT